MALNPLPLLLLQNISHVYQVHDIVLCVGDDKDSWKGHFVGQSRSDYWHVKTTVISQELFQDTAFVQDHWTQDKTLFVQCQWKQGWPDFMMLPNNVWLSGSVGDDWPLRLDSNVISFSFNKENTEVYLWEHYKVKGMHFSKVYLGSWTMKEGFWIGKKEKWDRRSNLWGVSLVNYLLPWSTWIILQENNTASGLFPDLLHILENRLNFTQNILLQEDGSYGSKEEGNWTGIVGSLQRGQGDFSSAALSVLSKRKDVIDYSIVLMEDHFALYELSGSNFSSSLNITAYLRIFGTLAWITIFTMFGALMGAAALGDHHVQNTRVREAFGPFLSRMWLPTSGSTNVEEVRKISTKLLFLSSAFLTFMLSSCFSSDLTAHMATGKHVTLQNCADIQKNNYKIFAQGGGAISELFSASGILSGCQGYVTNTPSNCEVDCAIELLRKDQSSYFYSPELLDPRLSEISSFPIVQPPTAIAFPKGSELRGAFNHHLLKLLQGGSYARLHYQWIGRHRSLHTQSKQTAALNPITMDQLLFPMGIVALGILGAAIVAFFERSFCIHKIQMSW